MPHAADSRNDPSLTEGMSSTERTLVLGVLAGLAAVAAALVLSVRHIDDKSAIRAFFSGLSTPSVLMGSAEPTPVVFGPVKMGMTARALRDARIDARFLRAADGKLIAQIQDRRAAFTAWFSSGETDGVVTRMRYDQVFTGLGVEAILDEIGRVYGKPLSSWCDGGAVNGAQECTFRWVPRDSVVVDARYRLEAGAEGKTRTALSMTAADGRSALTRTDPRALKLEAGVVEERLPF